MITCSKCGSKFRFISRFKTINYHKLECSECKTEYKMKYSGTITCIFMFLIFTFSGKINEILPETTFIIGLIRSLGIVVVLCYLTTLLLSYLVKFEELD